MEQLAWNGVCLEMVPSWWPGVVRERYLRLDGEEGPVLEVKWAYGPGGSLDRRLARTVRRSRKKGMAATEPLAEWRSSLKRLAAKGFENRAFVWGKDQEGGGVLLRHEDRKATLAVNVFRTGTPEARSQVGMVLDSLELTSLDEPCRWSLFGMRARTPAHYGLKEHKLMPGHFRLDFLLDRRRENRERPGVLSLDRVGPASVLLKDRTIDQWAESFFRKLPLLKQAECIHASKHQADWRLDATSSWARRLLVRNHRRYAACRFRVWKDEGSGFLAAVYASGVYPVKEEWFEGICRLVSFVPQA